MDGRRSRRGGRRLALGARRTLPPGPGTVTYPVPDRLANARRRRAARSDRARPDHDLPQGRLRLRGSLQPRVQALERKFTERLARGPAPGSATVPAPARCPISRVVPSRPIARPAAGEQAFSQVRPPGNRGRESRGVLPRRAFPHEQHVRSSRRAARRPSAKVARSEPTSRWFTRACSWPWTWEPARRVEEAVEHGGQAQLGGCGDAQRDAAQRDGEAAALAEGVAPEARFVAPPEREVDVALVGEQARPLAEHLDGERLELRVVERGAPLERAEPAGHAHRRRQAHRQVQVGGTERVGDVEPRGERGSVGSHDGATLPTDPAAGPASHAQPSSAVGDVPSSSPFRKTVTGPSSLTTITVALGSS